MDRMGRGRKARENAQQRRGRERESPFFFFGSLVQLTHSKRASNDKIVLRIFVALFNVCNAFNTMNDFLQKVQGKLQDARISDVNHELGKVKESLVTESSQYWSSFRFDTSARK